MSLNSLFPDPDSQKAATTVIGLISIFSAVLITMNQYVKSQQMMEAHRAAGLAQGKLYRVIMNELALRRDQRQNALEFLKLVRTEQDRLENSSPSILPTVIKKFNIQFADRDIEKPEIAGDLDETNVNQTRRRRREGDDMAAESGYYSPMRKIKSAANGLMRPLIETAPAAANAAAAIVRGFRANRVSPNFVAAPVAPKAAPVPPIAVPKVKEENSLVVNAIVETPPPDSVV